MSSILTNNSAMVALETLRGINRNLESVQSQISTGKKIATAKDNAAIWAISTVMSTDISSFKQITDSLNLGSSTVGVARAASEQVTNMLQEMKNLIVSAQEQNVDRNKIQTDIVQVRAQITSIVGAAQFNGQNLLKGVGSISVLSSLDRAADQTVTASTISVARIDLQTSAQAMGTTALNSGAGSSAVGAATIADSATGTYTLTAGAIAEGTSYSLTIGTDTVEYVSKANENLNDVAGALKSAFDALSVTGIALTVTTATDPTATDVTIAVANTSGATVAFVEASYTGGTAAGGLASVAAIDVTTDAGAASALSSIEGVLQSAIDAAASFGSSQKRIGYQTEFVTTLIDSLTSGVGAMTDADIEAASARLQSLQVQQQLGIQALSIANQQPQSLLSLFR
jgi:flagellin